MRDKLLQKAIHEARTLTSKERKIIGVTSEVVRKTQLMIPVLGVVHFFKKDIKTTIQEIKWLHEYEIHWCDEISKRLKDYGVDGEMFIIEPNILNCRDREVISRDKTRKMETTKKGSEIMCSMWEEFEG